MYGMEDKTKLDPCNSGNSEEVMKVEASFKVYFFL
jgi:hypothetical protein